MCNSDWSWIGNSSLQIPLQESCTMTFRLFVNGSFQSGAFCDDCFAEGADAMVVIGQEHFDPITTRQE